MGLGLQFWSYSNYHLFTTITAASLWKQWLVRTQVLITLPMPFRWFTSSYFREQHSQSALPKFTHGKPHHQLYCRGPRTVPKPFHGWPALKPLQCSKIYSTVALSKLLPVCIFLCTATHIKLKQPRKSISAQKNGTASKENNSSPRWLQ